MKLMVLDGNSIINRAYYGIRPLSTKEGLPTNAIYGFITTLQRLLDEEKPEALCVTFDRREPTFRHKADETYKATRHGMPEELAMQMPVLKQVLSAMALVQEYGSIDALYAAMPDVHAKPAMVKKLAEGEESARHSYWLATIVTDAPLDFRPEDNLRRPFKPELYDLFLRLEFAKLIEKYGLTPAGDTAPAAQQRDVTVTVEEVTDPARAEELLPRWRKA